MRPEMRDAVQFLYELPKFTKKNGLEHTRRLMHLLGDPCADRKVIHVAGSNGKGSVCSFIYHMLIGGGVTAAMFTSPHLVDIRERFQANGRLVTEEEFLAAYRRVGGRVSEFVESGEEHPTFFEFIYLMAMVMFGEMQAEYIVLETGLGGRLDATNSYNTPVLTVITPVSREHTDILGDTIALIASEKAGILKPGVPVVYPASDWSGDSAEAAAVIAARADELGCPAAAVPAAEGADWKLPGRALYQAGNAALAFEAVRLLPVNLSDEVMRRALCGAVWPGRMQEVFPEVWFDGAHNPAGIEAFMETVRDLTAEDEHAPMLLFSMLKDKDVRTSAEMLAEGVRWDCVGVTSIPGERSAPPDLTAGFFEDRMNAGTAGEPWREVRRFRDCREAFESMRAQKRPGQKLFCAGSLYFIGTLFLIIGENNGF